MSEPMIQQLSDEELSRSVAEQGGESGFGTFQTEQGLLPLVGMVVRARLDGLLSHVEIAQEYVNSHAVPLEATFIFPLPDRAALTRFRMEVAGRVVEGQLEERSKARETYDRAIEAGQRASIAEQERPDVFTIRVGNLMPGEHATVRLDLDGPLPCVDGEVTFRFPLVVAPRYIPGVPLPGPSVGAGTALDSDQVPDASRITPPVLLPGFPNPVWLSLEVELVESLPLTGPIRSSLHAVGRKRWSLAGGDCEFSRASG